MLFRQRNKPNLWGKIRLLLWPRRSFARSLRYYGKRLLRIPAKPRIVALGLAIGVFFAFTPLYGFHIVLAMCVAWALSANVAAAALGTVLANPLTIPLIFSATYETGRLVLPLAHKSAPMPVLWNQLQQMNFSGLGGALFQISVGSLLLGAVLAALAYAAAYQATKKFQSERKRRVQLRRRAPNGAERNNAQNGAEERDAAQGQAAAQTGNMFPPQGFGASGGGFAAFSRQCRRSAREIHDMRGGLAPREISGKCAP